MRETDQDAPAGVAIVRRAFERWASKDLPGFLELFDEDCETRPHLGRLEGGVYRGHEGLRRWFNDVHSDWTEFCPELRTFDELGDSLLIAGRIRARGRVSGVELDTAIWWRCTFRDGRILCMDGVPRAERRSPRGQAWGWLTRRRRFPPQPPPA